MKVLAILLFPILLFPILLFAQTVKEDSGFISKVDVAYANAIKGVAFALENIPERKKSVSKELIANNALVAKVKINKGVGGVSVNAVGFYNSYKVTVEVYRDYNSLKEEGVIEYIPRSD